MVFWETVAADVGEPAVFLDFAQIWQAADKIVYSRTLAMVSGARTALEREFDPRARAARTARRAKVPQRRRPPPPPPRADA